MLYGIQLSHGHLVSLTVSAASGRWSWIPLTALQAKVFGWEDMLGNPTYFKQRAAAAVADDDFEAGDPQDSVETEGPASGYPVQLPRWCAFSDSLRAQTCGARPIDVTKTTTS